MEFFFWKSLKILDFNFIITLYVESPVITVPDLNYALEMFWKLKKYYFLLKFCLKSTIIFYIYEVFKISYSFIQY